MIKLQVSETSETLAMFTIQDFDKERSIMTESHLKEMNHFGGLWGDRILRNRKK